MHLIISRIRRVIDPHSGHKKVNMRNTILFLIKVCVIFYYLHTLYLLNSQTYASYQIGDKTQSQIPIEVKTRIINEQYCDSGDPDFGQLRMSLETTFTNISRENIILDKNTDINDRIMIGQSPEAMIRSVFEADTQALIMFGNEGKDKEITIVPDRPDPTDYQILLPGESYNSIVDISIIINRKENTSIGISAGNHYLQITLRSYPEERKQINQQIKKWKPYGKLFSQTIISQPMEFNVADSPKFESCHLFN